MVAGAAFLLGAAAGLRPHIDGILPAFPFWCAEQNFYRAARQGMAATLLWPASAKRSPEEKPASAIIRELLPVAEEGLAMLGIEESESRKFLGLIRDRLAGEMTPARWQQRVLSRLEKELPRREALAAMLQIYLRNSNTGQPITQWSEELV